MFKPVRKLIQITSLAAISAAAAHVAFASEEASPATPPHGEDQASAAEHNKIYDASKHQDVNPGDVFEIISELSEVWDVKTLEGRRVDHKLREAQVAAKAKDYALAERLFIEALNRDLNADERYWALLQMAATYQNAGERLRESMQSEDFSAIFGDRKMLNDETGGPAAYLVKASSVYEKFLALYKDDDLVPFVNLQLGRIYRRLGANELANSRFYNVINAALSIRPANIPAYEDVTTEAKQEIAETFFLQGKYKEAADFYNRLRLLDLTSEARQKALFKIAYSHYMLGNQAKAKIELEKFITEFPDSILVPESYYLLANLYSQQNEPQKAVSTVLALLSNSQVQTPRDQEIWLYWQKRAANELANQFYEQADYLSALRIYQAMWDLDTTAEWRAPTMYQIGLCFSRIQAPQKAVEIFDKIIQGEFWDKQKEEELYATHFGKPVNDDVKMIQDLAKWHAENKAWNIRASNRILRLLDIAEDGS